MKELDEIYKSTSLFKDSDLEEFLCKKEDIFCELTAKDFYIILRISCGRVKINLKNYSKEQIIVRLSELGLKIDKIIEEYRFNKLSYISIYIEKSFKIEKRVDHEIGYLSNFYTLYRWYFANI